MLKEEMIYEDALDLMEKSIRGEVVNQTSLVVASMVLQPVWSKIYDTRVIREQAKEASTWKEELNGE